MREKRKMSLGTKLSILLSGAATVLGLLVVVLYAYRVIELTETVRNALAVILPIMMIVLSYTICRHLGLLKNQQKR